MNHTRDPGHADPADGVDGSRVRTPGDALDQAEARALPQGAGRDAGEGPPPSLGRIAVLPLAFEGWWESHRNKGIVAAVLAVPVALSLTTVWGPESVHVVPALLPLVKTRRAAMASSQGC